MEKIVFLMLLASPLLLCSGAVTHEGQGNFGKPQVSPPDPITDHSDVNAFNYVSEVDEKALSEVTQGEDFSFITEFHNIVLSVATLQHSLTNPLIELVQDPSAEQGVLICKLSRGRMILSAGLNELLESYHHWAKLGTSLEEPHCREDAKASLEKFVEEFVRAANDIIYLDNLDGLGSGPIYAYEHLKAVLLRIGAEFNKNYQ